MQRKLPELRRLHRELFEAASGARKKELRDEMFALEWEFMEATVCENGDAAALKQLQRLRTLNYKPFFLWRLYFLEAFQSKGGFDVVIGNPPYIRVQTLKDTAPQQAEYLKSHYVAASKGNFDIYVVFVEQGLRLLQPRGDLAYILPHKFFNAQYGESLRDLIAKGQHLRHVVHFGDQQVFPGATNYVCLFFLAKAGTRECRWVRPDDLPAWLATFQASKNALPAMRVTETEWNFAVGGSVGLFEKLQAMPVNLGSVARIWQGIVTSADRLYVLRQEGIAHRGVVEVRDREEGVWELEITTTRPVISDLSLQSYDEPTASHRLILPYRYRDGRPELIPENHLKAESPLTWKYLKAREKQLRARESGRVDGDQWYGYIYPKNFFLFESPKLIVQVVSKTSRYAFDSHSIYFTGGGNGPYYGIRWFDPDNRHSLHYLQALLNSTLLDFYLHRISTPFRGGYWSYGKRFIGQLPIRTINFSDRSDKARHDKVVQLVGRMLAAKKQWAAATTEDERSRLDQICRSINQEVDDLVYELYQLTSDEIGLVEESQAKGK